MNEDGEKHPDFVKSCNLLKDEIDRLLWQDCPEEISAYVQPLVVSWLDNTVYLKTKQYILLGRKAIVYSMGLVYAHMCA